MRDLLKLPSVSMSFGRHLWDVFVVLLTVGTIGTLDINRILAAVYVSDRFYHFDSFLMAPGWAHLCGLALNVDVISQYSMAIPVLVSRLAEPLGGFGYSSVLTVVIILGLVYFIMFYGFLRSWLRGALWATFGLLLAVNLHMFHDGVSPVLWRYPSATVLRYWFDPIVLYAVSRHCVTSDGKYLWFAFAAAGIALAYMTDTGVYLLSALYVYSAAYWAVDRRKRTTNAFPGGWPARVVLCAMPLVIALGVLFCLQGPELFTRQMWTNAFEFAGFFMQGWGAMPMHESLREGRMFAFFMGFFIPAVYVWTMIFVGGKCLTGRAPWKDFFAVFLSIYGLCLYQYFVNRSALYSYYAVAMPFVAIVCFWGNVFTSRMVPAGRRIVVLGMILMVVASLGDNRMFRDYPNVFRAGAQDPLDLLKVFEHEFDFKHDAQLIRDLTSPQERVALISNFETAILMASGRKPFFYYFPIIESVRPPSPVQGRNYLYTDGRFERTQRQIEQERPRYIFIDGRFVYDRGGSAVRRSATLRDLIKRIRQRYIYKTQGRYLVVFELQGQ